VIASTRLNSSLTLPLSLEGRGDPNGQMTIGNTTILYLRGFKVKHLEERRVRSDMKETL
jgi:hypothetical protein